MRRRRNSQRAPFHKRRNFRRSHHHHRIAIRQHTCVTNCTCQFVAHFLNRITLKARMAHKNGTGSQAYRLGLHRELYSATQHGKRTFQSKDINKFRCRGNGIHGSAMGLIAFRLFPTKNRHFYVSQGRGHVALPII